MGNGKISLHDRHSNTRNGETYRMCRDSAWRMISIQMTPMRPRRVYTRSIRTSSSGTQQRHWKKKCHRYRCLCIFPKANGLLRQCRHPSKDMYPGKQKVPLELHPLGSFLRSSGLGTTRASNVSRFYRCCMSDRGTVIHFLARRLLKRGCIVRRLGDRRYHTRQGLVEAVATRQRAVMTDIEVAFHSNQKKIKYQPKK